MRKIIMMAIAAFVWKKWQARARTGTGTGTGTTNGAQLRNPTPPF